MAQLLLFVRYEDEGLVKAEFLFCESLSSQTTAEYIFEKLDLFLRSHNIDWEKCIGVCLDGARGMTGKHVYLQKLKKLPL